MMNVPFRNKKNGSYYILYAYAENATNGHEGEKMCLYFKWTERKNTPWKTYARNYDEFFAKFEEIDRKELNY